MNEKDQLRLADALTAMRMLQDNLMYLMRSEGACTSCVCYKPGDPSTCSEWRSEIPAGAQHNGCEYWRSDVVPF